MRNYLFLVLLMVFAFSCEKNDELTSSDFQQKQLDHVLDLKGQAQRNAYILLEPSLKYQLWVKKLNQAKPNLNSEQIEVVNQLLKIMDSGLFEVSNSVESKYKGPLDSFKSKSKEVFTRKEFIQLFTKLGNNGLSKTDSDAGDGCECSIEEDFCWESDCENNDCESSFKGCGVLWNNECDGMCEG